MEVTSKLFSYETDSELVNTWRLVRNELSIPKDYLSDYGVIGIVDGKPIAAMWLYPMLGCKMCVIEGIISDPDSTKEERKLALDVMFENIHGIAKDMEYKLIICMTDNSSIAARIQSYGYGKDKKTYEFYVGEL